MTLQQGQAVFLDEPGWTIAIHQVPRTGVGSPSASGSCVRPTPRRNHNTIRPHAVRFPPPEGLLGVDKRPLVEINMKLFSLNEGAIHGYRRRHYRGACQTVEQGQTSLARSH